MKKFSREKAQKSQKSNSEKLLCILCIFVADEEWPQRGAKGAKWVK